MIIKVINILTQDKPESCEIFEYFSDINAASSWISIISIEHRWINNFHVIECQVPEAILYSRYYCCFTSSLCIYFLLRLFLEIYFVAVNILREFPKQLKVSFYSFEYFRESSSYLWSIKMNLEKSVSFIPMYLNHCLIFFPNKQPWKWVIFFTVQTQVTVAIKIQKCCSILLT